MTTVINLPAAWLPVADAVIKATIVLMLAAAVSIVLRRASAALRHLVWMLALCSALVLPALTFALPKWQLPLLTVAAQPVAQPIASIAPDDSPRQAPPLRASARTIAEDSAPVAPQVTQAAAPSPAATWIRAITWPQALLALWASGALLILARIVVGMIAMRFVARRGHEITDAHWIPLARELAADLGVNPSVRFLRSGPASMPSAAGVFRPAVIMPADADTWPETRLRIVLLHELAHVKRRDCLTHLVAQAACAFYWFNPLTWVAVKRARTERERACDDLVLACGTRGSDYADELLEMARALRGDRFPALLGGASLAMAHRSQLEGRLMAILDPKVTRAGLSRARALAAAAFCFVSVASLGALQPWTSAADNVVPDVELPSEASVAAPANTVNHPHGQLAGRLPQLPQPLQPPKTEQSRQPAPRPEPHPMPMPHVAPQIAEGIADAMAVAQAEWDAVVPEVMAEAGHEAAAWQADADRGRGRGRAAQPADPRLLAALVAALKDSDKGVRETAMHALVKMRDPSVFDPLVQALKDGSPDVREQAAFGLGQLRDKRAVPMLLATLKEDTSASVREQAVFALGQLRDPSAIDALAVALRDASASVREQAAFALSQIRDKRAVEPLISALKDTSPKVREQAAFALAQLRDPAAVEALIVAAKDTNASVRGQVVFALGQLRDPRAIDALTGALKDTSTEVRQQAAFALGQLVR